VAEQLPPLFSAQVVDENEPPPLVLQVMVPVGVLWVPASVSVMVAVQLVEAGEPLTVSELGEQVTDVVTVRLLTGSVAVPDFAAWTASPP
jgi:hypothetical protein